MFTVEGCLVSVMLTIGGYLSSVMISTGIPLMLTTSAADEWIQ